MEILFVARQVAGQVANAFAQYRYLDLRRASITLFGAVFGNKRLFALRSNRHRSSPSTIHNPYRAETAVFNLRDRNQRTMVASTNDGTILEAIETIPSAVIARGHALPAAQSRSFCRRQGQSRDVVQRSLDRK